MASTTGRKARGKDVANRVRDAFEKALDHMASDAGGVIELRDIFIEMLTTDPLKTLDTVAKFVPKEMMVQQDVTHKFIAGEPLDVEAWEQANLNGEAIHTEH